jgi:glutamate--cysteine ligase catalytic subunit
MKKFIRDTASGERPTLARWMRTFVDNHPDYTHNSILSDKVLDDLLMALHKIDLGKV